MLCLARRSFSPDSSFPRRRSSFFWGIEGGQRGRGAMKLTEKYEILELLTSGRIRTFRARERSTQEAMLVHTFECSGTEPLPSSTAAILMKFALLGPSPPGTVLKAGVDEESSSAYLVTRMPNAAVLQEWIHAYRVSSKSEGRVETGNASPDATAELSASDVDRLLAQSGGARPHPSAAELRERREITEPIASPPAAAAPPQFGGEFTRLFQELGAFQPRSGGGGEKPKAEAPVKPASPPRVEPLSKPREPAAHFADSAASPGAEPESFTQLFSSAKKPAGGLTFGPDATPVEPSAPNEPGSFTQQFFSVGNENRSESPLATNPQPATPNEPGVFTQEFLIAAEQAHQGAVVPAGRSGAGRSGAGRSGEEKPAEKSAPPPSTMFGGMSESSASSPGSSTGKFEREPEPSKSDAGEFTQFFRGPFDQPGAPSKPIEIPDAPQVRAPREQTGDFTRVFGKGTGQQADEPFRVSPPEPEPRQPEGSFTRIFGEGGARLGTSRLETGSSVSGSFNPIAGPTAVPQEPTTPPPSRTPSAPAPLPGSFSTPQLTNVPSSTVENAFLNRPGRNDATDVFRTPGSADAPDVQGFSSGPSEFTQFLSRSQISAALPAEPAIAPPTPAPSPSGFAAPPMPQPPPFQFAPPAAPPPPAVPAVPKPAFGAPQLPAVKPPAAGPPSYWPLITVLTILVAIAAMLVMYFALKH
jgi:hypothetical protein